MSVLSPPQPPVYAEIVLRQAGPTSTAVLIVLGSLHASGGRAPPEPDTAQRSGEGHQGAARAEYVPKFGTIRSGGAGTRSSAAGRTVAELPLQRVPAWVRTPPRAPPCWKVHIRRCGILVVDIHRPVFAPPRVSSSSIGASSCLPSRYLFPATGPCGLSTNGERVRGYRLWEVPGLTASIGHMVELRDATPADAHALATVHVASWRAAYRGLMPDEVLAGLSVPEREQLWSDRLTAQEARTSVVVATDARRVVGFAAAGPPLDPTDRADSTLGDLYALYLDPDHWGRGIGAPLHAARSRPPRHPQLHPRRPLGPRRQPACPALLPPPRLDRHRPHADRPRSTGHRTP